MTSLNSLHFNNFFRLQITENTPKTIGNIKHSERTITLSSREKECMGWNNEKMHVVKCGFSGVNSYWNLVILLISYLPLVYVIVGD